MKSISLSLLVILGFAALAASKAFPITDGSNAMYISPNGNDNNPGTQALPKKTLSAAVAGLASTQDTIVFDEGSYSEASSVVISGRSSITLVNGTVNGASVAFSSGGIVTTGLSQVTVSGLKFAGMGKGTGVNVTGNAIVSVRNCTLTSFGTAVAVESALGGSFFGFNIASDVTTFFNVNSINSVFDENTLLGQAAGGGCVLVLYGSYNTYSGFNLNNFGTGLCITKEGVAAHGYDTNLFAGSAMYGVTETGFSVEALSKTNNQVVGNVVFMSPSTSNPAMMLGAGVTGLYVANSTFAGNAISTTNLVQVEAKADIKFFGCRFELATNGLHLLGPVTGSMTYSCWKKLTGNIAVCDTAAASTCINLSNNGPCVTG